MFSVLSTLRSLLGLIVGRRRKDAIQSETAANIATTGTPEGSKVMSGGFDMKGEIAKLAERIVEPVAAKLGARELDNVASEICSAFEQLNAKRATADINFESMAANILEPIRPTLSEPDFTRMVDRLRGAMAGFCQGDRKQDVTV